MNAQLYDPDFAILDREIADEMREVAADEHELIWVSGGVGRSATEDYRWECTCGFRPTTNWPEIADDFVRHVREAR